mmetsp:Transcript_61179/g.167715  ORF Transcript_61179/g.167715 Transcript_61179/m.167715 type:complete len:410 (-) Transcript_61179:128-1357(-)
MALLLQGAIRVPRIAVRTVLSMVRSSVRKRTGCDIYKLEPIKGVEQCAMPALFITGAKDEMIPTDHGESLASVWMGPKLRISFHGGHNTPRPPHIYDAAGTFLRAVLEEAPLDEAFSTIRDLCENAPSELPPGWQSAVDPGSGDTYYFDMYTHKTTWFRPYKPSPGHERAQERAEQERLAREARSAGRSGDGGDGMAALHAGTVVSKERAESLNAAVVAAHRNSRAGGGGGGVAGVTKGNGGGGEMLSLKGMLADAPKVEGAASAVTTTDAHTNGGDDVSLMTMLRSDRMVEHGSGGGGEGGGSGGNFAVQPLRSSTMAGGAVSPDSANGSPVRKGSGQDAHTHMHTHKHKHTRPYWTPISSFPFSDSCCAPAIERLENAYFSTKINTVLSRRLHFSARSSAVRGGGEE